MEVENNNLHKSFEMYSILATYSLLYYGFYWKLFETLFFYKFLHRLDIFIFLKIILSKDVIEIMLLLCFAWDSYSPIINSSIIVEETC